MNYSENEFDEVLHRSISIILLVLLQKPGIEHIKRTCNAEKVYAQIYTACEIKNFYIERVFNVTNLYFTLFYTKGNKMFNGMRLLRK